VSDRWLPLPAIGDVIQGGIGAVRIKSGHVDTPRHEFLALPHS
jgi:hypothetical protein